MGGGVSCIEGRGRLQEQSLLISGQTLLIFGHEHLFHREISGVQCSKAEAQRAAPEQPDLGSSPGRLWTGAALLAWRPWQRGV
jgi:hypothetical protein